MLGVESKLVKNIILLPEFVDIYKVLDAGVAKGYAANGWLEGVKFEHKANCNSMLRHLAEHSAGLREDSESKLDPLLHLACRAVMAYTIHQRELDIVYYKSGSAK